MNMNKIRGRIVERGMSQKEFCEKIEINYHTFYNYCKKNVDAMPYKTLKKMIDLLCDSDEDIINLFFS